MNKAMKIERYKEPIAAIFLFLLAGLYFIAGFTVRKTTGSDVGSAFVPRILSVLLAFLSGIYFFSSLKKARKLTEPDGLMPGNSRSDSRVGLSSETVNPVNTGAKLNRKVLFTIILLGLYVFLLGPLGFIVASCLYLFFQILLLGEKGNRKPWLTLAVSILTTLAVYSAFVFGLRLMLPRGVLDFLRF